MKKCDRASATVEAELRAEVVTAQIVHFEIPELDNHIMRQERAFWLDLSLTPRPQNARACYPDRWGKGRYKPLGTVFFTPPGEVLRISSNSGRQTSIVCRIDPELMTAWFEGELEWTPSRLEAGLDVRDESIRCHLMRATREVSHRGFASEMSLDLIAAQLAIELGRYSVGVKHSSATSGLARWRLSAIDERVREPGKPPSLSELADLCGLSVRQLSRGFRVSRNCSIGHYVEHSRIENAKRLLISGRSVKAVAYTMGFASPSSFSSAFHRATGIPPVRYRRLA